MEVFKGAQDAVKKMAATMDVLSQAIIAKDVTAIADTLAQVQALAGELTTTFPQISAEAIETMDVSQILLRELKADSGQITLAVGATLQQVRQLMRDAKFRFDFLIGADGAAKTHITGTIERILPPLAPAKS